MNEIDYKTLDEIHGCLAHLAVKSNDARRRYGNERDFDPLPKNIDPFLIDIAKIQQSKGWRRLMEKTQVMTGQTNAHIRMRAGHTEEVAAHATFIAACLGLNINMVHAVAKGHDVGHTPFGHEGESFINEKLRERNPSAAGGFKHENMSSIVFESIERCGIGLNLTHQTLTAIPQHSRGKNPLFALPDMTQEAAVVMCADKIAYISGDFSDMERIGVPLSEELKTEMYSLGNSQRQRTRALVTALCRESAEEGKVSFHKCELAQKFKHIKELMYRVYPALNIPDGRGILERVYKFLGKFMDCKDSKPRLFCIDPLLVIALMTDKDVLLLVDGHVTGLEHLKRTSVWELLPSLHNKEINYITPKLDW